MRKPTILAQTFDRASKWINRLIILWTVNNSLFSYQMAAVRRLEGRLGSGLVSSLEDLLKNLPPQKYVAESSAAEAPRFI